MSDTNLITTDIKTLPTWRAIQYLVTGQATTQKQACEMAEISPDTFLRHVRQYPELGLMLQEFKAKLETDTHMRLESFLEARDSLVGDMIIMLENKEEMLQNRIMALNKLEGIFGKLMHVDTPKELSEGTKADEEAKSIMARALNGAILFPANSKVTVELARPEDPAEGEIIDDAPPDQIK